MSKSDRDSEHESELEYNSGSDHDGDNNDLESAGNEQEYISDNDSDNDSEESEGGPNDTNLESFKENLLIFYNNFDTIVQKFIKAEKNNYGNYNDIKKYIEENNVDVNKIYEFNCAEPNCAHRKFSLLTIAISSNDIKLITMLVEEFGADVNLDHELGYTPILIAAELDMPISVFKILLKYGADISQFAVNIMHRAKKYYNDDQDYENSILSILITQSNNIKKWKFLIANGAKILPNENILQVFIMSRDTDISRKSIKFFKYMLDNPDIYITINNRDGVLSPLFTAIYQPKIIRILLDDCADVNLIVYNGFNFIAYFISHFILHNINCSNDYINILYNISNKYTSNTKKEIIKHGNRLLNDKKEYPDVIELIKKNIKIAENIISRLELKNNI